MMVITDPLTGGTAVAIVAGAGHGIAVMAGGEANKRLSGKWRAFRRRRADFDLTEAQFTPITATLSWSTAAVHDKKLFLAVEGN